MKRKGARLGERVLRASWRSRAVMVILAVIAACVRLVGGQGKAVTFPRFPKGDAYRSFEHPFQQDDISPVKNFVFFGDAAVRTRPMTYLVKKEPVDHVRLTPSLPGRSGLIVNSFRTRGVDFDAAVDVEILKGARSAKTADGMAFWLLKDVPQSGPVYGIENKFSGLGIIVDTYSNSYRRNHPYVYAWVNNGMVEWDDNADGHGVELVPGCEIDKVRLDAPTRLSIQLRDGSLRVAYSVGHFYAWKVCFEAHNVRLPFNDNGVFALSGSTGTFFAEHFVSRLAIEVVDEGPGVSRIPIRSSEYLSMRASEKDTARQAIDESSYRNERMQVDTEEEQQLESSIKDYTEEVDAEISSFMDELDSDTAKRLLEFRVSFGRTFPKLIRSGKMVTEAHAVQRRLEDVIKDVGSISDELQDEFEALHSKVRQLSDTVRFLSSYSAQMHGKSRSSKLVAENEYSRSQSHTGLILFAVVAQLACAVIFLLSKDGAAVLNQLGASGARLV